MRDAWTSYQTVDALNPDEGVIRIELHSNHIVMRLYLAVLLKHYYTLYFDHVIIIRPVSHLWPLEVVTVVSSGRRMF